MQYIDHCSFSGATPLIRASREVRVKKLQTEVCQLLVASKADVSAKDLWYDSHPTHHREKHTQPRFIFNDFFLVDPQWLYCSS
jgi:hypothetical protein